MRDALGPTPGIGGSAALGCFIRAAQVLAAASGPCSSLLAFTSIRGDASVTPSRLNEESRYDRRPSLTIGSTATVATIAAAAHTSSTAAVFTSAPASSLHDELPCGGVACLVLRADQQPCSADQQPLTVVRSDPITTPARFALTAVVRTFFGARAELSFTVTVAGSESLSRSRTLPLSLCVAFHVMRPPTGSL